MIKDCIAVLEISSTSITFLIGEHSVNGAFAFRFKESVEFYSYFGGEITDVAGFEETIVELFNKALKSNNILSITKMYVGAPGEFTKTLSKNYRVSYNKIKRITENEVNGLFDLAYAPIKDYSLINKSAVYYQVGNVKTHSPLGEKGDSLSARLSYIYVSNYYKEIIDKILYKLGVKDIFYVSTLFAKNYSLFSSTERDNSVMLIDVGGVSTEFFIASGNGILYSDAFSLGGEVITARLYEEFGTEYEMCKTLKDNLNLGYRENSDAIYPLIDKDENGFIYPRDRVNEIARTVIGEIYTSVRDSLAKCTLKVPSDISIKFTGEGICNIRGAVEYLASRLGTYPDTIKPTIPHYNKPQCSGFISLFDTALAMCKDKIFFATKRSN